MEILLLIILNGLSWGMLLFLISIGLTIILGVMGILNFAHGSFFMLGAYLCMQSMKLFESFWLGMVVGPLITVFIGVIIEKFLLKKIYDRDITFQLLLTFGLLLIIDDTVKMIWGAGYHVVEPPQMLKGIITVLGQDYPIYRIFIIFFGIFIGVCLWLFFKYSRIGKIIRASAYDREMAEGLGINVSALYTAVFALGTWLAALGGVLASPHQSLIPSMGERIIIESFIIVVIGGMGSFPGALLGALTLGICDSFGTVFAGRFQMAIPYILLATILIFRPRGFFGKTT